MLSGGMLLRKGDGKSHWNYVHPFGVCAQRSFADSDTADFQCAGLIHFGVLLLLARKCKADGQVAGFYLIFYSAGRFVLEFFRGDLERGSIGMLSTSQFIAIFTLAAGILMVLGLGRKKIREPEPELHS